MIETETGETSNAETSTGEGSTGPALAEILALLTEAAVEVMDVQPEDVTPQARFVEDLGGDSLSVLEILEILQDKLDVDLPTEAFDGVGTVGQAAEVIAKIASEAPAG